MKKQKRKIPINQPAKLSLRPMMLGLGVLLSSGLFALSYATAETILPGVLVEGVPVGGLREFQAERTVQQALAERRLRLTYQDRSWTPTASQLGVSYKISSAIDMALRQGRTVSSLPTYGQIEADVFIDRDRLEAYLKARSADVLAAPVEAGFVVAGEGFTVRPHVDGMMFDSQSAVTALQSGVTSFGLETLPALATVTTTKAQTLVDEASALTSRSIQLEIEGQTVSVPAATLRSLVTIEPVIPAKLGLDSVKTQEFLETISQPMVHAPESQRLMKGEQRVEVVSEGRSGTKLDLVAATQALTKAVMSNAPERIRLATVEIPRTIEYLDAPVPPLPTGKVISVDLTQQRAWLFQDSRLIYSMNISSGINDWTPTGTFQVYAKTKKQKMSGPGYFVPNVPNILWFKGDYSMHGVYWHQDFGIRPRSHGCVGQSVADSEFTYNWGEVGTPIVIYKS